jgi:hypothetical protein
LTGRLDRQASRKPAHLDHGIPHRDAFLQAIDHDRRYLCGRGCVRPQSQPDYNKPEFHFPPS